MTVSDYFACYGVPFLVLVIAYIAMRLNAWDVDRSRRKQQRYLDSLES